MHKRPSRSAEFVLAGVKFSLVKFTPIGTQMLINFADRNGDVDPE